MRDPDELSTQDGTMGGPTHNINNEIMSEREKLIKYNRAFIRKNKKIPTTTLDFYKFVKVSDFELKHCLAYWKRCLRKGYSRRAQADREIRSNQGN